MLETSARLVDLLLALASYAVFGRVALEGGLGGVGLFWLDTF